MTKQVHDHPDLLTIGQDIADAAQLLSHVEKAEANARTTAAKLSALRKQLLCAVASNPDLQRADAVGVESSGFGWRVKLASAAAVVVVAAGIVAAVVVGRARN